MTQNMPHRALNEHYGNIDMMLWCLYGAKVLATLVCVNVIH